ncbi:hypothetical protein WDW86_14510 [Bdellovibrionota bacterium FG-2]
MFKALSFGHWLAAADWLWIKSFADPTLTHVAPGTHPELYYNLDLITDLDPAFFDLYVTGANLLAVVRNDGAGARDLLRKGASFYRERLPQEPEAIQRCPVRARSTVNAQ